MTELTIYGTRLTQQGYAVTCKLDGDKVVFTAEKPTQTLTMEALVRPIGNTYQNGCVIKSSSGWTFPTAYTIEHLAFNGSEIALARITCPGDIIASHVGL